VKARGGDGAINNAVNVTSYNLCGLEGLGHFVLTELCTPALSRGVIFLQEHWLSPGKMAQLENFSPSYLTFGVSGMEEKLSAGILRGRPFGGAAILVHSSLGAATTPLLVTERLNVVRIFNVLFINVYCPTRSLGNRAITASMLGEIETVLGMCKDCEVVMGGDFNMDLRDVTPDTKQVIDFMEKHGLILAYHQIKTNCEFTFFNSSGHKSMIDFFLLSSPLTSKISGHAVNDDMVNFSDHHPLTVAMSREIFNTGIQDMSVEGVPPP